MARANMRMGPITQFCTSDRAEDLPVPEHVAKLLVAHLGQRRVHHEDQPDGYGDVRGADLESVDEALNAGNEIAQRHPRRHGQKDPQREEAVEEREPAYDFGFHRVLQLGVWAFALQALSESVLLFLDGLENSVSALEKVQDAGDPQGVVDGGPPLLVLDDTGVFQDAQVLGYGRHLAADERGELTDGMLVLGKPVDDVQPAGMCQGLDNP